MSDTTKAGRAKAPPGRKRGGGSGKQIHLHLKLNERLVAGIRSQAAARRLPVVAIVEAAMTSYLSENGMDERDALLARPLNRLSRAFEGLEWNSKLLVGMLGYLTELTLAYGPEAVTAEEQEQIDIKRARRFDRFEQWLAQEVVDPNNLHSRLSATVSTTEKDFIEAPPAAE